MPKKVSDNKEESNTIIEKWKSKLSHKFVMILAVVSVLGFIGIVSETLFARDISATIEALWMLIIGIGLILEAQIKILKKLPDEGLTPNQFTHLITAIIGAITVLAGFFSFPFFHIENPAFHAIRGIVSIIAIIVIIIQTWIVE